MLFSRENPLVKPMAPRSNFHHIFSYLQTKKNQNTLLQFIYIYFILPFTYLLYLSLLDLTLASVREGINNLFFALCASFLVCAGASIGDLLVPPTGLIPWFLTEGNNYLYFAASSFPLQGKKSTQAQEVAAYTT